MKAYLKIPFLNLNSKSKNSDLEEWGEGLMANGTDTFSEIFNIDTPSIVQSNRDSRNWAFRIRFSADGPIPYVRVMLHASGGGYIVSGGDIFDRRLIQQGVDLHPLV